MPVLLHTPVRCAVPGAAHHHGGAAQRHACLSQHGAHLSLLLAGRHRPEHCRGRRLLSQHKPQHYELRSRRRHGAPQPAERGRRLEDSALHRHRGLAQARLFNVVFLTVRQRRVVPIERELASRLPAPRALHQNLTTAAVAQPKGPNRLHFR